jgi:hypothetical protein
LTTQDLRPVELTAETGGQRRKAAFALLAVVFVLAVIVLLVTLAVGGGPAALAIPSPTATPVTFDPVPPDPPSSAPASTAPTAPSGPSASPPTATAAASQAPARPPTPAPAPTPTASAPPFPDATGPIQSAIAGRCVSLNKNDQTPGTIVRTFVCNGTESETWTLTAATIRIHTTLCLQPAGPAPGTGMVVQTCDGSGPQQWELADGGVIRQAATGLCLTVPQDSAGNVQLTIDVCTGAAGQAWMPP